MVDQSHCDLCHSSSRVSSSGVCMFAVQETRMHGTSQQQDTSSCFTDTACTTCQHCKTDLWLSAIVSPSAPGRAVCPEHAAALGAVPSSCRLLFRHSIEELQRLVFEAVALFPGCDEFIRAAQQRVRQRPWMRVKSLGPLMDLAEEYPVPRVPELKPGGRDPATPAAGKGAAAQCLTVA